MKVAYVPASQVERGDTVVIDGQFGEVSSVNPYRLADSSDRVVTTSNGPSHRWGVIHFLLPWGGIVRFPHELLAVVRMATEYSADEGAFDAELSNLLNVTPADKDAWISRARVALTRLWSCSA